jgi:FkbM family methyltransferase
MIKGKIISAIWRLLPLMPAAWRLRVLAFCNSIAGGEIELKYLRQIGPCRGMAIDVGASCGYYSLALSGVYDQVVSFEPNHEIAAHLIGAHLKNVRVVLEGLSSVLGESTLHIPIADGVKMPGWASLDEQNCPNATSFDRRQIALHTLDEHDLHNVGFIKIDVEGHELEVLRGAEQTLRRDHPHLLVEVRAEHLAEVRTLLLGWGYRETTLRELVGREGSPENLIFVPNKTIAR